MNVGGQRNDQAFVADRIFDGKFGIYVINALLEIRSRLAGDRLGFQLIQHLLAILSRNGAARIVQGVRKGVYSIGVRDQVDVARDDPGFNHPLEVVVVIGFLAGKVTAGGKEGDDFYRILIEVTIEDIIGHIKRPIHPSTGSRPTDGNLRQQSRYVSNAPIGILGGGLIISTIDNVDIALIARLRQSVAVVPNPIVKERKVAGGFRNQQEVEVQLLLQGLARRLMVNSELLIVGVCVVKGRRR